MPLAPLLGHVELSLGTPSVPLLSYPFVLRFRRKRRVRMTSVLHLFLGRQSAWEALVGAQGLQEGLLYGRNLPSLSPWTSASPPAKGGS